MKEKLTMAKVILSTDEIIGKQHKVSKDEAFQYCKELAYNHYENFIVTSLFIPKVKRQHLYNLYAFCRWADDLADETGDPAKSFQLLQWWQSELHQCYQGHANHPVYVALQDTIETFQIPIKLFEDLLNAFIQDQQITRYETYAELLDYCSRSANPVGRLYLLIFGCNDPVSLEFSDCTCTSLQLTNFWQDIVSDIERNRIYIPQEDLHRFCYTEEMLREQIINDAFRGLLCFEVDRTRELFIKGLQLTNRVDRRIRLDIDLFNRTGMDILAKIEQNGFDVFNKRPTLSHQRKIFLLLWRLVVGSVPSFRWKNHRYEEEE
jgi:squalene synthase HpnC